jgi:hypothetical protein
MTALPPPSWPISDDDGGITQPWYAYLKTADDTWRVSVTNVTSLSTAVLSGNLLSNNGVSLLEQVPASTVFLSDPVLGCRKTLCVVSTSTAGKVWLQTTTKNFRPGAGWILNFPTSAAHKTVELMGISTSEYLIVSNPGGVTVTTV